MNEILQIQGSLWMESSPCGWVTYLECRAQPTGLCEGQNGRRCLSFGLLLAFTAHCSFWGWAALRGQQCQIPSHKADIFACLWCTGQQLVHSELQGQSRDFLSFNDRWLPRWEITGSWGHWELASCVFQLTEFDLEFLHFATVVSLIDCLWKSGFPLEQYPISCICWFHWHNNISSSFLDESQDCWGDFSWNNLLQIYSTRNYMLYRLAIAHARLEGFI